MTNEPIRVLLMEDSPADASLLQEMLSETSLAPFELKWADRLSKGLGRLAVGDIDVVLLDLVLPDSWGISTLLQTQVQAPQAAVIVLTSLDDEQLALQAVREGAQDYLIKGRVDRDQLARAICYAQQRKQAQAAIQQRSRELAALNSIARTLSSSMKLSDVLKAALHITLDALGLAAGCIHLLDRDSQELVLAEQTGLATELTTTMSRIPVGVGIPGRAAETCSVVFSIGNVANYVCTEPDGPIAHPSEVCCFLSAPLRLRGRVVGVISAVSYSPRVLSTNETGTLSAVGDQIGVAIGNAQLIERARQLSLTDSLTGLPNMRHFQEAIEIEMSRARRTGRPFCLTMVDIDGFKHYNTTFGHTNGDKLLKSLAQKLKSSLRKVDLVFRLGADEFAIMLPATDARRARIAIDRVRPCWTKIHEEDNRILESPLSFSAGIAQFPDDADTVENLMHLATSAVCRSKQDGGHRSTLVSDLDVVLPNAP